MIVAGLGLCALFLLIGTWQLWNIRGCGPVNIVAGRRVGSNPENRPAGVTIVVPSRNEERRLPGLLNSLAALELAPDEIIVVDDHSTDRTAEIARAAGALVLNPGELPPGWTGKCWACWQGARAASGSLLIFLDADTWLEPTGLTRLIQQYRLVGGLLSVQPYHVTSRAYEQLSAITNVTIFMAVNTFTPLGQAGRPHATFGPCIVCDRAEYLKVGGHSAVRSAVLEDYYLGKIFLENGRPVTCLAGRGTVNFRMYPDGFGQMVEGWSKTFGSGSTGTNPLTTALITGWILAASATFFLTIASPVWPADFGSVVALPALLYAAFAVQIGWMLKRIGAFQLWIAALYPLSLFFLLFIFLRASVQLIWKGEVRWKGRDIVTRQVHRTRRAPAAHVDE
jgi:4,4'-diaponeurosporenoate glycosyltransferase